MSAETLQAMPDTSQDMFGFNTNLNTDCFSLGVDPMQKNSMVSMDALLNVATINPVDKSILIFADEKAKRKQPRDDFAVVRQLMSQYGNSSDFINSSQELYQRALEIQYACCPP